MPCLSLPWSRTVTISSQVNQLALYIQITLYTTIRTWWCRVVGDPSSWPHTPKCCAVFNMEPKQCTSILMGNQDKATPIAWQWCTCSLGDYLVLVAKNAQLNITNSGLVPLFYCTVVNAGRHAFLQLLGVAHHRPLLRCETRCHVIANGPSYVIK